jgi:adenylosuccinate lyase
MENLAHKIKTVTDSLEREKELVAKQRLVIEQLEKDLAEVQEMVKQHENLIQSQDMDEVMEDERVMYQLSCSFFMDRAEVQICNLLV